MGAIRAFFVSGFDWDGAAGRAPVVVGLIAMGVIAAIGPTISSLIGGALAPGQVVYVLSALIVVQLYGTIVRRLHDAGRSGWWLLLAALPYGPVLLMLALLALPSGGPERMRRDPRIWRRLGFALACLLAVGMASRAFWTDHLLISDIMTPSLESGDYVAATTLFGEVERGDIVVYTIDAPGNPAHIMRVIGLPGETISVSGSDMLIDGAAATFEPDGEGWREVLPDGTAHPVIPGGAMAPGISLTVPEGHVFLLADNRALDAAFASEARAAQHVVAEARIWARVARVLASSGSWRAGAFSWIDAMRWDRVWRRPE